MLHITNTLYDIHITGDPTYRLFSADNATYDLVVEMDAFTRSDHYTALSISVTDWHSYAVHNIAVVGGIYSFSTQHCAVLDGAQLLVLMQDTVASIDLRTLQLQTKRKVVDFGTAFAIYPFGDNYVIHAELEVVCINPQCHILWSFSGRDIFVLPSQKGASEVFRVEGDYIVFYDWNGQKYVLDSTGREMTV